MRLEQYLAHCGVSSRRQAQRLIAAGRVSFNGQQASPLDRVNQSAVNPNILLDGAPIAPIESKQYWLYHKPVGIDCRLLPDLPSSLIHILPPAPRLYPAGRLDKDSRGLLLLTNDGELTHRLMHPDFGHEKVYLVTVDRPFNDEFIEKMSQGVSYRDVTTKPCKVTAVSENQFQITLTQGLNRQIRRMAKALGYNVIDLVRMSMMNCELLNLAEKQMRPLEAAEISVLRHLLKL
ncbi:pseudouridine synthase [Shewanella sp. 10N.7]|uniref:Pseudouridine synthase n=1 Tax=Shewanella electrodiphila TaxID=934143 RepID=A0ABT0KNS4_9GAMM|nr:MULTISPECIES: 23S rRNA pseudouridine(2604) synthase RluF [Shewanella]MCC4834291.1 pseudouridine synthase [Shewanella sp. 10N.7]MCL1045487.1 pseudouridine synthase [Shewanella electrodiphila]